MENEMRLTLITSFYLLFLSRSHLVTKFFSNLKVWAILLLSAVDFLKPHSKKLFIPSHCPSWLDFKSEARIFLFHVLPSFANGFKRWMGLWVCLSFCSECLELAACYYMVPAYYFHPAAAAATASLTVSFHQLPPLFPVAVPTKCNPILSPSHH